MPCQAKGCLRLELPFPPSVNQYWRNVGRTILSEKARKYHQAAGQIVALQLGKIRPRFMPYYRPVAMDILLRPPDRKRRDLDNFLKALLDTLTRARVWNDDSLVKDLHMAWDEPDKDARVLISIWEQRWEKG